MISLKQKYIYPPRFCKVKICVASKNNLCYVDEKFKFVSRKGIFLKRKPCDIFTHKANFTNETRQWNVLDLTKEDVENNIAHIRAVVGMKKLDAIKVDEMKSFIINETILNPPPIERSSNEF